MCPPFYVFLEREGGSHEDDTLVPGGFLSSCERVASAGWKEGKGGKRARAGAGATGGGRMDSFIFLVDLAYISPPPEADTKTNGLSSRSYKTSPPTTSPFSAASRHRLPPPPPPPPCAGLPSNANVKHWRGELTFSTSCQTWNRAH